MSALDYPDLLIALYFLYAAAHYTFSQRFFGHALHWPLLWGGYPLLPFSRWLSISFFTAMGLWKIADGLFQPGPSPVVAAILMLSLISVAAAYRHDRRLARTNVT